MAKAKTVYECSTCGEQAPRWGGRCNGCGHWNTMSESVIGGGPPGSDVPVSSSLRANSSSPVLGAPAQRAGEVATAGTTAVATGIGEFDRVMGGGLCAGSVTLLGGEPGVGKSTLLVQVAASCAARGQNVLYVSAEESVQQVTSRLERMLGRGGAAVTPADTAFPDNIWIGGEPHIGRILADIVELKPDVVIVDSIQTVFDQELTSAPGSVTQVRHCAHRLTRAAKETDTAVVLVGQVTKDGSLAGPRVLEHLVDTVVSLDGDRELGLRVLRAMKHRFGPTGELGVMEMSGRGLIEVGDPSTLLLADRRADVAGSSIGVSVEGRRALVVEMQALVTQPTAPSPRRSTQGLDQGRLSMLLAVLNRRAGVKAAGNDVYASVIGGIKVSEPGVDLALCCAVASSMTDTVVSNDVVIMGEVGLAGEVRSVPWIDRRLAEAARLGFRRAIVPAGSVTEEVDIDIVPVATVSGALNALNLDGDSSGASVTSIYGADEPEYRNAVAYSD